MIIRRSPCEVYLKYLLVHPDGYSPVDIRSIVRLQQLDFIGMPYLESLRKTCIPPRPFYPEDRKHHLSNRFLRREKLLTLYQPDDDTKTANYLLGQPRAKETIEAMLISRADHSWICTALRRQGFSATPEAIKQYSEFYFDVELVDTTELRVLLDLRGTSDSTSDADEQILSVRKLDANKGDARRLSANMVSPTSALMMNIVRMGYMPSSLEVGRLAAATRMVALMQAEDSALRNSPERGRDFAIMAKMMTEILEQTGDPEKSISQGIAEMTLETSTVEIPHIKKLAEDHTLDVQPIPMEEQNDLAEQ